MKKSSSAFIKALNYADKQNTDPVKYNRSNQYNIPPQRNVFMWPEHNTYNNQYGLPYNNIVPILPQIKPVNNIPSVHTFCTEKGYTKITKLSNPQSLKPLNINYSNHNLPVAPPSSRVSYELSRNSPPKQSRNSPAKLSRNSPPKQSRNSPAKQLRNSPAKQSRNSPPKQSRNSPPKQPNNKPIVLKVKKRKINPKSDPVKIQGIKTQ